MFFTPIPIIKKRKVTVGAGLYSQGSHDGESIYTRPPKLFRGAWYVSGGIIGQGDAAKITVWVDRGYVNGLEPMIGKTVMSGGSQSSPPSVTVPAKFDSEGRAWVGILIQIDPSTGNLRHTTQATMTEKDLTIAVRTSAFLPSADGSSFFHPIAVIRQNSSPIQIAYFDYQWGTMQQHGIWRHFLIPA